MTGLKRKNFRYVIVLCAVLLVLPVILNGIGLPSRRAAYLTLSANLGPVGYLVKTIFDDPTDADILFLGTSPTMHGILPSELEHQLKSDYQIDAKVRVLAFSWGVYDFEYFMLRDYLQHHKSPKLLVVQWPRPENNIYDCPNPQMHQWFRFGDYPDTIGKMPLRYQMKIYGEEVIGGPRQALSFFNGSNLTEAQQSGSDYKTVDDALGSETIRGNSFASIPEPKPLGAFIDPVSVKSPKVKPFNDRLAKYSLFFLREIIQLAEKEKIPLAFCYYPFSDQYGESSIPTVLDEKFALPADCKILGAPMTELFPDMSHENFDDQFVDVPHLTEKAATYFDRLLAYQLQIVLRPSKVSGDK